MSRLASLPCSPTCANACCRRRPASLYASAKARFDARDHGEAAKGFTTLLALLKDEDLDQDMPDRADLKTLGEGFLSLSTTALLPKETAPVRPPAIAAPDAEPPTSIVYTIENTDVVPPADVERRLPPWDPTNRVMAATARRGILEVIVNERGTVESAILRAPVSPYYDKQLLEAAGKWRFKPATKNGTPVKFRRLFAITLQ